MLRPIGIASAHMECRDFKQTLPVLTDLLAFEQIAGDPAQATLKHPNTDWLLIVHEGGSETPVKQMHNHFGVRVATKGEVDAAHDYLTSHKKEYGLIQIGQPLSAHGSYSLYFLEPGTNGWEIECYEDVQDRQKVQTWSGGVWTYHWEKTLPAERFPGRGYVPQGFTHGTLAIGDLKTSWNFYSKVLGLEVFQANDYVVYVKHPKTKCYIVCAERENWKGFSANFRFTIHLESRQAVADAYRWLSGEGKDLGVTELWELQANGAGPCFFLRDPDGNCWELSAPE